MRCWTALCQFVIAAAGVALSGAAPALTAGEAARPLDYRDRKPTIDAIDRLRVLSADRASALEKEVQAAYDRLAPCTVRIWVHGPDGRAFDARGLPVRGAASGVIIDKRGLVLTCAHHNLAPRTAVTVELGDGRRVKGVTLGRFAWGQKAHPDLGLVRIEGKGEWPAAAVAGAPPGPGTVCLAIGYPRTLPPGGPPLLRAGRTLPACPDYPWLLATTAWESGDSGGPLFDLGGRVLGVLTGGDVPPVPTLYQPVAPLKKFRARLEAGEVVSAPSDPVRALRGRATYSSPFAPAPDLEDTVLTAAVPYTVRVRDGTADVALGLVIDPEGWAVTKRTLVDGRADLNCLLGFAPVIGRPVRARVAAASVEHDLALLKLDGKLDVAAMRASGIGKLQWAPRRPRVGQFVCPLLGRLSEPTQFGVIGAPVGREDPPARDVPQIMLDVAAGPRGEPVYREPRPRPDGRVMANPEADGFLRLLQEGDVITSLGGIPTPTIEAYAKAQIRLVYAPPGPDGKVNYDVPAPGSLAGEPVVVGVLRNGRPLTVRIHRVHSAPPSPLVPRSVRRDGFPAVFAHDVRVRPEQCGGPVVDLQGRVVGLNVARADGARTLVIPADVLREVVARLRKEAVKKAGPQ
jgi:serine protease Do